MEHRSGAGYRNSLSTLLVFPALQSFPYTQNGTEDHHENAKDCASPGRESLRPHVVTRP